MALITMEIKLLTTLFFETSLGILVNIINNKTYTKNKNL